MKNNNNFIYNKNLYNYIMENMYFNNYKKEKYILELWYEGYNNCDIARETGYSEGTIRNRKKTLENKINKFLIDNDYNCAEYSVYMHIFPNKKVYIGMTKNIEKRWSNGRGYIENTSMYDDIIKYGWDNIKHIIIQNNLTYTEAHKLENDKIKEHKSYLFEYGYNTYVILEEKKGE